MPPASPRPSANLVQSKLPCPECGSSDALAIYDDGHGFCFSHGKIVSARKLKDAGFGVSGSGAAAPPPKATAEIEQFLATAKCHPIASRKLTAASTKRWDYRVRRNPHGKGDRVEHLALYRDKVGKVVAVKIRTEDPKDFHWIGKTDKIQLYGQHMWGAGGKYLTITEGEIDAISVSQAFDHKYPVVSVPGGAAGAAKAIASQLEWINSFDKVVLMFDQDEPGQEAAQECAEMLAPGKAYIAFLAEKDPNELLKLDRSEEIVTAFWNAKKFSIGGVIDARELTAECKKPVTVGLPWPWDCMTQWTFGRRPGEVYLFGSGTGMGKSDFMAEIAACTLLGKTKKGRLFDPQPMAVFNYEAEASQTKLAIAGKLASRRFHIPDMPEFGFEAGWTVEERDRTLDFMDNEMWNKGGRLYANAADGTANWDDIISRCRFLCHAENVRDFVVDPVGAVVADMEEDDQVKFLDRMFRQAANLALELKARLYIVSHLTRPKFGPSHEEGGHVSLSQFRGSNGIGMFTHYAFGLERNQQAETEVERLTATVRVVKDRRTGLSTGKTSPLIYDPLCGTLDEPNTGEAGI